MGSLLCHELWYYIILSYPVTKEKPGWRHGTGSMSNIVPLLMYFPLRSKVAVRNCLCMNDFPLPVDSLNAPSVTMAGLGESEQHSHPFFMEIPSRSLPVNKLDRELWKSLSVCQGQRCALCAWDSAWKRGLLLHHYGTRRSHNWKAAAERAPPRHLITSPSPSPRKRLTTAGEGITGMQQEYKWIYERKRRERKEKKNGCEYDLCT